MTTKRPRRTFTEEFKRQLVTLYNAGKPRAEILEEYQLTPSAFDRWVSRINATGSTKEADNRDPMLEKINRLERENQQLKMEVDILKQAALIMGRKSK